MNENVKLPLRPEHFPDSITPHRNEFLELRDQGVAVVVRAAGLDHFDQSLKVKNF